MNIIKLTCTEGGLAFMKCMKEYVVGCPELYQMTTVVNVSSADLQWAFDNLDNLCSKHFGPCAAVQQCIELGSNDVFDPEGGMILSATAGNINLLMGMNPYLAFMMQASMICGPMKRQFDCMVNHLDKCPDEVEEAQQKLRSSIEESVQSNPAFGSYDDMKIFMNEDCKKMPAKLSEDRCLRTAFSSRGFMICFYNAITSYTEEKGEKCKLYKLQSHCMDVYVSGCGKEKTDFMKTNMHRIINVPASCKPEHEEL